MLFRSFSFDRRTGDLWIGDVGQNAREEIDFQAAGSAGGENYGWSLLEGTKDTNCTDCDLARATTVLPVYEYAHTPGVSAAVAGGYVYRGNDFPTMTGRYFSAEIQTGQMWSFATGAGAPVIADHTTLLNPNHGNVVSFGEDANGEVYMVDPTTATISRIIETTPIVVLNNVYVNHEYFGPQ